MPSISFEQLTILLSCLVGWGLAQGVKALIGILRVRSFDLRKAIFATGGMPSGHAASVSALAAAIGLHEGLSTAFAVAVVLMFITLRDAVGVRLAAGDQARILNEVVRKNGLDYPPLAINHGHTPLEVGVGALVGIAAALGMWLWA